MSKQTRWRCPACGSEGWSTDGRQIPHDNAHGSSCRASGQISERAAKAKVAFAIYEAEGRT